MKIRTMLSGGILCGGRASRFKGFPKGNLIIYGRSFIEFIYEKISKICDRVVISANNNTYAHYGIPVIEDIFPGLGPAGGIYTLLHFFEEMEGVFVLPCDIPLISLCGIQRIIDTWQNGGYEIVVASNGNTIFPVVGVYSTGIVQKWKQLLLQEKEYRLHRLVSNFRYGVAVLDNLQLFNVNEMSDYHTLKRILKQETNGKGND